MAIIRNMHKNRKLVKFLEWLVAWEIIVFSGNSGTQIMPKGKLFGITGLSHFIIFATCMSVYVLKSNKKFNVPQFGLVCFIFYWMFSISLLNNSSFTRILGTSMNPICAFLLISVCDFKEFRELLLSALTKLSALTLFIYYAIYKCMGIGVTYILPTGQRKILFLFCDWWGRPASIYQEPGQYQIILFSILLLFVDELVKINFTNIRYFFRKFGIIIAAILAAQSSMGYICLMMLVTVIFVYSKSVKHNILTYTIFIILGCIAVFFLLQSDTIQDKINSKNLTITHSSLFERVDDTIRLFRMSFISPLTGIGSRSPAYYRYGNLYGGFKHKDGINGLLNVIVSYGWPFFFLLMINMLRALRRMKQGVPPLYIIFILFISLCDETYALYMSTWLYVFKFNSYS